MLRRQGLLTTTRRPIATGKVADGKKQKRSTCGNDGDYIQYHDFRRAVSQLQPHQTLAINRGEAAGEISVSLEWDVPAVCAAAARVLADTAAEARGRPLPGTHQEEVKAAAQDGIKRLLKPAIERELRSELTAAAQVGVGLPTCAAVSRMPEGT